MEDKLNHSINEEELDKVSGGGIVSSLGDNTNRNNKTINCPCCGQPNSICNTECAYCHKPIPKYNENIRNW